MAHVKVKPQETQMVGHALGVRGCFPQGEGVISYRQDPTQDFIQNSSRKLRYQPPTTAKVRVLQSYRLFLHQHQYRPVLTVPKPPVAPVRQRKRGCSGDI